MRITNILSVDGRKRPLNRFLAILVVGILWLGPWGSAFGYQQKPNVIFILADDLGWGDPGCYGGPVPTPNLDKLAADGRLFTNFYVNSGVCSPSRASFLTGIFPASLGIHGHLSTWENNVNRSMVQYLEPDLPTLADVFLANGYATGMYGKWHLGGYLYDAPLPDSHGFEEHRTNTSADKSEFNLWDLSNRPRSTKMVLDEALAFIKRNKDKPFFVNAWLVDPHSVLNPSEEQLERFSHLAPATYTSRHWDQDLPYKGIHQVYQATVFEMDRQIGLFLEELESMGLSENTIVIFSSDNGPEVSQVVNASNSAAGSAGPFRGCKRSLYEGGIRVPLIVRWPKGLDAGEVETRTVSAVDFLPTLPALCGLEMPADIQFDKLDGENVSAMFLGVEGERKKPLFWEWRFAVLGRHLDRSPALAMRKGDWKLLANPDRSRLELYNLRQDPSELNNLAPLLPDLSERMLQELLGWKATLPPGDFENSAGLNDYKWPE